MKILDCDGSAALGLQPKISVQKVSEGTPSGTDETISSTSGADTGTVLRYTDDGQYIYNLATKSLLDSTATYQVTVTIPTTGQTTSASFGLKR